MFGEEGGENEKEELGDGKNAQHSARNSVGGGS